MNANERQYLRRRTGASPQFPFAFIRVHSRLVFSRVHFASGGNNSPVVIKMVVIPAVTGGQPAVQPVGGAAATDQMGGQSDSRPKVVSFKFKATRDQIFKAFPAIANLADKSDGARVSIEIEGISQSGFEPPWLRNAVEEPLDEAGIERQQSQRQ